MINDIHILRELAKRYRDCCERPGQDELRGLWRRHNTLKPTRPLVIVMAGGNRAWSELPDATSQCEDSDFKAVEDSLRKWLWVASLNDDSIFEPWITVAAERVIPEGGPWGVKAGVLDSQPPGGGRNMFHDVPIKSRADMAKLVTPRHVIDEEKTRIRKVIADGLEKSRGCFVDITLKDIYTVQGAPERIPRWVSLVRSEIDKFMGKGHCGKHALA